MSLNFHATRRLLEAFYQISTLSTAPLPLDDILQKILDEVVISAGLHRGIISLLDEKKENIITKVVNNYSPAEAKRAFSAILNLKRDDCIETKVAKTGQYVAIEDSGNDPRITTRDRLMSNFYKMESVFYAALKIEDEIIGTIAVWSKEKTKFTPEDINILLTFANQISITIYNARLFEDNRNKIHRMQILQEAVSQLNATYALEEMHEIVIANAIKISRANKVILYFQDIANKRSLIIDEHYNFLDTNKHYDNENFLKIERSIIKKALEADEPITNYPHDDSSLYSVFDEYPSEIAFPIKMKEKYKGVLFFCKTLGYYSADEINALDILVKNASVSYDNGIMHSMLYHETKTLQTEVEILKERHNKLLGFHNIIGNSEKMIEVYNTIKDIAAHNTNVLIQGESGTGKELIARAVHRQSDRSDKNFVDVNCAAIPGTLLESELFGYEAGAFTDARKRKIGLLEYADGGSILLDEIGEMGFALQAKFLRVLEDGYIRRLGGTKNIPIDVRFIFSTNRDLRKMAAQGTFREDLFYRISVIPIVIPPLRERQEDIVPLAYHFIEEFNKKFNKKVKSLSSKTEKILKHYSWPGNVRELKNIIERMMILQSIGSVITPEYLPAELKNIITPTITPSHGSLFSFDSVEYPIDYRHIVESTTKDFKKSIISKALDASDGNQTLAAKQLGISRYTLIRELKKISPKD